MTSAAAQTGHSDTTTEGIRIRVGAAYSLENSEPKVGLYYFIYRVIITNESEAPARLTARYWRICDANHEVEEVQGEGVVGEQPRIPPGESFEYMSGCPLATPWGTMEGYYVMEREDGSTFQARIGRFLLAPTTAPLSAVGS